MLYSVGSSCLFYYRLYQSLSLMNKIAISRYSCLLTTLRDWVIQTLFIMGSIPVVVIIFAVIIYLYIKNSGQNPKCPYCQSRNTIFSHEELNQKSKYKRELEVHKCKNCNSEFERVWNDDYIGISKITKKR